MAVRHIRLALAPFLLFAAVAAAQEPTRDPKTGVPRFRVDVVGDVVADFRARVSAYVELRDGLQKGLPPLAVDDPARVRAAVDALAARIRVARAGAKRGDIFTPAISREFRKLLLKTDDSTWADIVDDNPGEIAKRINGSYPETKPFSTVPANILALLPRLPDSIEYRFLGRHLILLDTRASLIVDWITFAVGCDPSLDKSACHR
jgi:hypothetical protein